MGRVSAVELAAPRQACNRCPTQRGRFRMPDVTAANPDIATPELMKAISAAFNSRDVDRIVSHFTDDATCWLARGPEPVGRTLKGKEMIRKTLADRFKVIPDMRWDHKEYVYAGNRAIS